MFSHFKYVTDDLNDSDQTSRVTRGSEGLLCDGEGLLLVVLKGGRGSSSSTFSLWSTDLLHQHQLITCSSVY